MNWREGPDAQLFLIHMVSTGKVTSILYDKWRRQLVMSATEIIKSKK